MFESHFALRENPFVAGHQSRFIYPSPEHQEALAHLRYGIENREPFVLITGEVGTGKTTALFEVLGEWKAKAVVAVVTNSALSRNELLEEIALRLGFSMPPSLSKPQLLSHLERNLLALRSKGERAILLLDEGQNLDRELLEEIRLLSNLEAQGDKLLQVFLLGQPELDAKLARPELRQLRQRVAVHYRLSPLSAGDTERYIHHRIAVAGGYGPKIMPHETCAEVFALTHGIPREINQLCSQALLNAFVDDAPVVLPQHVQAAAREIEFESVLSTPRERASAPVTAPAPPSSVPAAPPPPAPAPDLPPIETHAVVEPAGEPEELQELPLHDATEHEPSGVVVAATDEANWEAWVRSLMLSRPEPMTPQDHTTPPEPSVVPDPIHVPVTPSVPSVVPEPVIVPDPDPDRSPAPQPDFPPEPPPDPKRAIEPEVAEPAWSSRAADVNPIHTIEKILHAEPAPLAAAATPIPAHAAHAAQADTWRPPMWTPGGGSARPAASRFSSRNEEIEEDAEVTSAVGPRRWIPTLIVLLGLAVSMVLLFRFGPFAPHASRTPAPAATTHREAAPAKPQATPAAPPKPAAGAPQTLSRTEPSAAITSDADGPTIPGPVLNAPAAASKPATESKPATASVPPTASAPPGNESAAKPSTVPPPSSWSLVVGTYLDEARARDESQRLGTKTGLPARVRTVTERGSVMYQVALGAFHDRAAAERTAGDLVGKSVVSEARVVARRRKPAPTAATSAPTPTP